MENSEITDVLDIPCFFRDNSFTFDKKGKKLRDHSKNITIKLENSQINIILHPNNVDVNISKSKEYKNLIKVIDKFKGLTYKEATLEVMDLRNSSSITKIMNLATNLSLRVNESRCCYGFSFNSSTDIFEEYGMLKINGIIYKLVLSPIYLGSFLTENKRFSLVLEAI